MKAEKTSIADVVQATSGLVTVLLTSERALEGVNRMIGQHRGGFDQLYEHMGINPGVAIAGFGVVFLGTLMYEDWRHACLANKKSLDSKPYKGDADSSFYHP